MVGRFLRKSVEALIGTHQRASGVMIEYHRGDDMIEVPAILGQSMHYQEREINGVSERYQSRDFVIEATTDFIEAFVKPEVGDKIKYTIHNTFTTFEVLNTSDGAFREFGQFDNGWRVHTKEG